MKEKKATLITILVLLGIFGSITLFGTLVTLKNKIDSSNLNHEFKFENKLYFYDDNDELLGVYECQTDNCGYINTTIDDSNYGIDYYKDGTLNELEYYSNECAYIQDGDKMFQYSFTSEKPLIEFNAIKTYNTELKNKIIFFKKGSKWGALSLKSDMVITYDYDFLGLKNDVEDGVLNTDHYIALKDDNWYILDSSFTVENSGISKAIKTYTDEYIICVDNSIYDYSGNELASSDRFVNTYVVSNYIVGITNTNIAIVYKNPQGEALGYTNLEGMSNFDVKYNNNAIEFYENNTLKQSIALN